MIGGVSNNVTALRNAHERVGQAAHDIANSNPQNVRGSEEVPPVERTDSTSSRGAQDRAAATERHTASRDERGLSPDEVVAKRTPESNESTAAPPEEGAPMARAVGELIEAKMEHGANIAVIHTQDEMVGTLLDAFG